MIGVDTNVLLRLFVIDDQRQNASAAQFFRERSPQDPAYVTTVVIAEFVWVLEKRFRYARDKALSAVDALLRTADVVVEHGDVVAWAVDHASHPKIDFSDALIAETNRRSGCRGTVTFDADAAKRIAGMELLK